MPYTPSIWKDDIVDTEGNVVQQGTAVTASKLNNIENGIMQILGNHQMFVEDVDPTTINGYVVNEKDIWFDTTEFVIKLRKNNVWNPFGGVYKL